ncbi:MAG: hypothetical protein DRQ56_05895 [Gammaproteobacteria bacterium]|nr:MAG: hypothetical protein DRQ56_05895 [Gammaproteobacteria bacterium]
MFSWAGMQYFILLTWVAFRITNTQEMLYILKKLVLFDIDLSLINIGLGGVSLFSTLALLLIFWALHSYAFYFGELDNKLSQKSIIGSCVVSFIIGMGLILLWPSNAPPFIYFQF